MSYRDRCIPFLCTCFAITNEPVSLRTLLRPSEDSRSGSGAIGNDFETDRRLASHFRDREVIYRSGRVRAHATIVTPCKYHFILSCRCLGELYLITCKMLPFGNSLKLRTTIQSNPAGRKTVGIDACIAGRKSAVIRHESYTHKVISFVIAVRFPIVLEVVTSFCDGEQFGSIAYSGRTVGISIGLTSVIRDIKRFGATFAIMGSCIHYPLIGRAIRE